MLELDRVARFDSRDVENSHITGLSRFRYYLLGLLFSLSRQFLQDSVVATDTLLHPNHIILEAFT